MRINGPKTLEPKETQTLEEIEQRLEELQGQQESITTSDLIHILSMIEEHDLTDGLEKLLSEKTTASALTDVLSLIQEHKLTDEVKKLLSEKITKEKKNIVSEFLDHTPESIKKPIPQPTRIENANKKIELLISFITKFIEKIEKLDSEEYKLYTVKQEHEADYFATTPRGNENIGGKFLGYKYDIRELEDERNDVVEKLQSMKSRLDILNRSVSIVDKNNDSKEEQETFDELREKIFTQEEKFLQIYDNFKFLIIPSHIADTINTEQLYQEENITAKIQEYFNGKYSLDSKEDTIPDGIDQDSLDFQEKIPLQKIKTEVKEYFGRYPHSVTIPLKLEPVPNPLTIEQIEHVPLQYPMYEHLSYSNPEHKEAQGLREKYSS